MQTEIVERRGSHHYFASKSGEVKLGNGRDAAIEFLETNPDLVSEIDAAVRLLYAEPGENAPVLAEMLEGGLAMSDDDEPLESGDAADLEAAAIATP